MKELTVQLLEARGIVLDEMAALAYEIQHDYIEDLTLAECRDALEKVLEKREVQHAVCTALALDMAAEKGALPEGLNRLIRTDAPLYGVDESFGFAIANLYGTIGATNFGYLDKLKPGLIARLNDASDQVNTFADDVAGALIAAGAARLAHHHQNKQ